MPHKIEIAEEPGFYLDTNGRIGQSYFVCPECNKRTYFGTIISKEPTMVLTIVDKPE